MSNYLKHANAPSPSGGERDSPYMQDRQKTVCQLADNLGSLFSHAFA
jgi:hypothetical protein